MADHVDLAQELAFQTQALDLLQDLQSNEDLISAHVGSLSGVVDQLFFIPLDQHWDATTEALLQGDQALDAAIASGSGLQAAELAMFVPDMQLVTALVGSVPVALASIFF